MDEEEFDFDDHKNGSDRFVTLVIRSSVPTKNNYRDYLNFLRHDFFYTCGYCTLSEFEAQGIAFEIDHYEPVSARPELECTYENLIYACGECNQLKGDLTPPAAARNRGYLFFRPDSHKWDEHFDISNTRLIHRTKIGEFTIEYLDLNRLSLRRLRELRQRVYDSETSVAAGILALRKFRIDQLPPTVRSRANSAISHLSDVANKMEKNIDDVLKAYARSPLLDFDSEKQVRLTQRRDNLSVAKGLYPGAWRGRTIKAASKRSAK